MMASPCYTTTYMVVLLLLLSSSPLRLSSAREIPSTPVRTQQYYKLLPMVSSRYPAESFSRCGNSDKTVFTLGERRNYTFFPGRLRWCRSPPINLTYALSPLDTISYISQEDIKAAFRRSFDRWAAVIPITFTETTNTTTSDIKIGFFSGYHGDNDPFDNGLSSAAAHAYQPEFGLLHMNKARTWSVNFKKQRYRYAVDIESFALHEIGHVLGLGHSTSDEAIMFPTIPYRSKKIDLTVHDVEGIQILYGSNPDFNFISLVNSDAAPTVKYSRSRWYPGSLSVAVAVLVVMSFIV